MTSTDTAPKTITIPVTAPAVICDETDHGTAILVEPGTYAVESIDHDEQLAFLDVPTVDDWYVAVSTDWLADEPTRPPRPKAR